MSVPLKFPTRTPSGPWSSTTTSRIVIAIVTSTFARLATE